ncbi:MAG TPA: hypothetical protein VIH61_07905 [Waddliaceae bacterium]
MKKIKSPHKAWWFIMEHPAFRIPYRTIVHDPEAEHWHEKKALFKTETFGLPAGESVCYLEHTHMFYKAIEDKNHLWIYFAKPTKKNKKSRVWLEFGPIQYWSDHYKETAQHNKEKGTDHWIPKLDEKSYTTYIGSHDPTLDSYGATFDDALVQLANKIFKNKEYGNYKDDHDGRKTCGGKDKCPDCINLANQVWVPCRNSKDEIRSFLLKHKLDCTEEELASVEPVFGKQKKKK